MILLGNVFFVVILISGVVTGAVGQDGACSETQRTTDLPSCLSGIRQIAGNSSYFWYGSIHAATCPAHLMFTSRCYNEHQGVKTLADLAFGVDNADLSSLDRYVDVKYSSGPGSYVGCDYSFTQSNTINFTVDPLSDTAYTPWNLRTKPEVTWTGNQNDLFTLIVIDAGHGFLHGLFVNIPGNNVSQGNAVKDYHGPRNTREVSNTYAFIVYKQPASVNQNSIYLPPFSKFNVSSAAATYTFGEPVGLSWVLASHDAYAMALQAPLGIIQNCANLVSTAFQDHPHRPFLPDMLDLNVYLRLHFTQDATTYPCGNERKSLEAVDFYADPIGIPIVATAAARSESTRKFSMQMNKMFPNNTVDFNGKMYSLVTVDPDIPSANSYIGNNQLPLLHGLITNIQGDDVSTGTVIKSYIGPQPPDSDRHVYYFLLYEQQGSLQMTTTSGYTDQGRCNEDNGLLVDRCQFNVTLFASTNNLQLVGATWIAAKNDEYVNCLAKSTSNASATVPTVVFYLLYTFIWTSTCFFRP